MIKVSISEAARLAGIARSNFYTTYIKKGRISVSKDSKGKKFIDMSELLRVFPTLKQGNSAGHQDITETVQQDSTEKEQFLQAEVEQLKQQLQETKTREAWYQQQVAEEKARAIQERLRAEKAEIKRLEHLSPLKQPSPVISPDKQLQDEIEGLKASLQQLSARRWWQVWK